MPVHDWSRVSDGVFHSFHQRWIHAIYRSLNSHVLPSDYYAMIEQRTRGLEPDRVTLHVSRASNGHAVRGATSPHVAFLKPRLAPTDEGDLAFYRRKKSIVTVREAEGDLVVAVIEIISPGNKSSTNALRSFVEKSAELLNAGIHLLVIDIHAPTQRDPHGLHAVLWDELTGTPTRDQSELPFTLVSYEATPSLRAFVERVGVGQPLPAMPLFLQPNRCVEVPLEETYQTAFHDVLRRGSAILEA